MVFQYILNASNSSSILLIIFTAIILILYNCVLKNWWYFSNRKTEFIRGWPIVGSLDEFFFGQKSFADTVLSYYQRFPNEAFIGIYELTHPVFVIRDPELVKKVTIQDFDHFFNHQTEFDRDLDSLMSRTLFFNQDQPWKDMRSILSASFTGNKMRMMFDLVCDSTNKFVSATRNQAQEMRGLEIELKDLLSRFTTNMIASTAFGLEIDTVTNRDNEFFLAGKKITNFDGIQGLKLLLLDCIPNIMKMLRIRFLDQNLSDYFRGVVLSAMKYRETNNIFRPDMVQLMMEARKGTLQNEDAEEGSKKMSKRAFNGIKFDFLRQFSFE